MGIRLKVPLFPAWFRWLGAFGIAAFIFYTSIITVPPEPPVEPVFYPLDKWLHFVAYAALGGALAYAIADWTLQNRYQALLVFVTIVVYGVGIEVGQAFIPYRYFSVGDAYANALGAVLIMPWFLIRPYLDFQPLRAWLVSIRQQISTS